MLLGNLRRAVALLQEHSVQRQLHSGLLAWRDWATRRRHLAHAVADRLQGRYLGGVWEAWRRHTQYSKLARSQGLSAMTHFTGRTTAQVGLLYTAKDAECEFVLACSWPCFSARQEIITWHSMAL